MGVVLTTGLILAIVLIALELRIVYSSSRLKKLVKKGPMYGIGFSLFLAFLIGTIFGASGLVVMVAGLVAMTFTESVHTVNRSGVRDKANEAMKEYKDTYRPVGRMVKVIFLIITSPIWLPVKIRRAYLKSQSYAKAS